MTATNRAALHSQRLLALVFACLSALSALSIAVWPTIALN